MALLAPLVFTAEEEARLKAFFTKLDRDNKGFIAHEELKAVCRQLGHEVKEERIEELILKCDPGKTGKIMYEPFVKAMAIVLPKLVAAIILVAAFRQLDPQETGFIARAELEKLVIESGIKIEKARLDEIILKTNPGPDGRIEFKAFAAGLAAHLRSI